MKRALFLFVLCFACGAALIIAAHADINERRDSVELTDTVLFGDPAAADGLEISLHTSLDRHLFWDTTHAYGGGTDTQFLFSQTQIYEDYEFTHEVFCIDMGGFGGVSGTMDLDDDMADWYEFAPYLPVIRAVASRAPLGEEYTETVYLADYMDYYPLTFTLDMDALVDVKEVEAEGAVYYYYGYELSRELPEMNQWLNEQFKMPVSEQYALEITVCRSGEAQLSYLDINLAQAETFWVNLWSDSAVTENACYVAFSADDQDGEKLDDSLITGGFGIFRIPIVDCSELDIEAERRLMVYELENVYSLPEDESFNSLTLSDDGRDILMLSRNMRDDMLLTVFDAQTMEVKQKEVIAEGAWLTTDIRDNLIVSFGAERLVLFEKAPTGEYIRRIDADTTGDEVLESFSWQYYDIAWDGERLALVTCLYDMEECYDELGELYYTRDLTCGCSVTVYSEEGCLYRAAVSSSLLRGDRYKNIKYPNLLYNDPISARWK